MQPSVNIMTTLTKVVMEFGRHENSLGNILLIRTGEPRCRKTKKVQIKSELLGKNWVCQLIQINSRETSLTTFLHIKRGEPTSRVGTDCGIHP